MDNTRVSNLKDGSSSLSKDANLLAVIDTNRPKTVNDRYEAITCLVGSFDLGV